MFTAEMEMNARRALVARTQAEQRAPATTAADVFFFRFRGVEFVAVVVRK
jgi:hypothetical protein